MPVPTFCIQTEPDGPFKSVSPMEALLFVLALGDDAEISNPTVDGRVFIRKNPAQPHFIIAWGNLRGLVQTEIILDEAEAKARFDQMVKDFDACLIAETADRAEALFMSRVFFCLSPEELYNSTSDSIHAILDRGRDRAEALRAETN